MILRKFIQVDINYLTLRSIITYITSDSSNRSMIHQMIFKTLSSTKSYEIRNDFLKTLSSTKILGDVFGGIWGSIYIYMTMSTLPLYVEADNCNALCKSVSDSVATPPSLLLPGTAHPQPRGMRPLGGACKIRGGPGAV